MWLCTNVGGMACAMYGAGDIGRAHHVDESIVSAREGT
jgi:hypothetical protein